MISRKTLETSNRAYQAQSLATGQKRATEADLKRLWNVPVKTQPDKGIKYLYRHQFQCDNVIWSY